MNYRTCNYEYQCKWVYMNKYILDVNLEQFLKIKIWAETFFFFLLAVQVLRAS